MKYNYFDLFNLLNFFIKKIIMNENTKLIITIISVWYIYHIIYNVSFGSISNKKIKKIISTRCFIFISLTFVILGILGWFDKSLNIFFNLIGFLLPITFILIDI